jgi:hypothetical protein
MKPIMSFWSKPYIEGFHNKWINEQSWNLSWILSVECLTKIYGKPHLYTDDAGAEFLTKTLRLDFASINTCLNDLKDKDARFFSLGRAYALGIQNEPFVHVDYDAFLQESIPPELFNNGVMFQKELFINLDPLSIREQGSPLHRPDLIKSIALPDWWANHIVENRFRAYQLGVVGGSNLEYFQKYSQIILDIASSNVDWDFVDQEAKRVFRNKSLGSYGFAPQYTLDQYTAFALAKEMKIIPRFLINSYNIIMTKYSHVSFEKASVNDLYGRMMRRILSSFPHRTEQLKTITSNKQALAPRTTVVIIPNTKSNSIYDTVLRAIIPRKLRPDEVIVTDYLLSDSDRGLISKLEGVRIIPGGGSYIQSLENAFRRSSGDLVIAMDGHVKPPKLYIEKSIAAYLEYPTCAFCSASTDFAERKDVFSYGALKDDYGVRPNLLVKDDLLNTPETVSLFGGLYAFPKKALHLVFEKKPQSFDEVSDILVDNGYLLRCMKNLVVSHSFKESVPA